ncbi:MAG: STAS domain-containing protein [Verrucomicrobiota bacterium]
MFSAEQTDTSIEITLAVESLDASNAPEFKSKLDPLGLEGMEQVKVDCGCLDFVDSSGVGALLNVNNRLQESAKPVTLFNVTPQVVSVLELLRIHRLLEVKAKD